MLCCSAASVHPPARELQLQPISWAISCHRLELSSIPRASIAWHAQHLTAARPSEVPHGWLSIAGCEPNANLSHWIGDA
eukprot:15406910-Alexandrium_andersonii.AAC.1